jgi:hypothetical protein
MWQFQYIIYIFTEFHDHTFSSTDVVIFLLGDGGGAEPSFVIIGIFVAKLTYFHAHSTTYFVSQL